jgi:hypothetical protein
LEPTSTFVVSPYSSNLEFPRVCSLELPDGLTAEPWAWHRAEYPYFLTNTIVGWLPVFTRPEAVSIIYDSWRHCQRERGFLMLGYVILENHLHLIASTPDLPTVMQNFQSFTARPLIDLLERRSESGLLS